MASTPGNVVQYAVVPVCGADKDHLSFNTAAASALTPPMTITGQNRRTSPPISTKASSRRSGWRAILRPSARTPSLPILIAKPGTPLRNALSGLLRPQLLALLDDVKKNNGEIYAALYELNDPELIARLQALGQKCHLILANGAFKPPANDENKAVRAQLHGKVDLHDRLVSSGHFAHNKFVVACDSAGKPQRVLSGSTNWTVTGLCTQANNGILVDDADLGAFFINEWNLLKAAGNGYPASLMQANSTSKSFTVDGGTITQWFAPTSAGRGFGFRAPADQRRRTRHPVPVLQSGRVRAGRQAGDVDAVAKHPGQAPGRHAELRSRSLHPRRGEPGDRRPHHRGPDKADQEVTPRWIPRPRAR